MTNGVAVRMAVLYLLLGPGDLLVGRRSRRCLSAVRVRVVLRGGTVVDARASAAPTCSSRAGVVTLSQSATRRSTSPRGRAVLDPSGCFVGSRPRRSAHALREPGGEESETVESAARAAALGGYTAVVAMPNTEPAIDCASVVREVLDLGTGAMCRVCVAGAITVGRAGERLAPMARWPRSGCGSSPTTARASRTPG